MGANVSRCEPVARDRDGGAKAKVPPPPPPPPSSKPCLEEIRVNPGTYDDVHKKCRDLFPVPFEGAKVAVNMPLNPVFGVCHNIVFSSITPSGYRLSSWLTSSSLVKAGQEPTYLLFGDIDPDFNLNTQGFYNVGQRLRFKYMAQTMHRRFSNTQFTADVRGKDWTASGTIVNPNIFTHSGIGIFQFLQTVTPKIAVGVEAIFEKAPQIPIGTPAYSVCGRFTGESNVLSGHAGKSGVGLCYYRRIDEDVQVGIEFENNFTQQQKRIALAYQFNLEKDNFNFKAMIDNNWTVTSVFEKRLLPSPLMFSLCASLNHIKNQFRMGCSISVGH